MDGVVQAQNKLCSNKLSTSCYTEKMFSLSSFNCEKNCTSSDRTYRRRSFNSSLHSIDETESLDFQRSRKRELCSANIYPEKRQSDPLLHCTSFINREVDVELKHHKYLFMYDNLLETTVPIKSSIYPTSKIKVRISDECGNRIDTSLDSQSDSDVDDFWNFGAAQLRNINQSPDDDAFNIVQNEEIIRPNVNECRKCGHKSLVSQFSTTFS